MVIAKSEDDGNGNIPYFKIYSESIINWVVLQIIKSPSVPSLYWIRLWYKESNRDTIKKNGIMGWDEISMKSKDNLFKWKHYEAEMILLTVRWYLKYCLSYRDVAEMMKERGLNLSHTTIMRWVREFGPEIDKRIRPYLKPTVLVQEINKHQQHVS